MSEETNKDVVIADTTFETLINYLSYKKYSIPATQIRALFACGANYIKFLNKLEQRITDQDKEAYETYLKKVQDEFFSIKPRHISYKEYSIMSKFDTDKEDGDLYIYEVYTLGQLQLKIVINKTWIKVYPVCKEDPDFHFIKNSDEDFGFAFPIVCDDGIRRLTCLNPTKITSHKERIILTIIDTFLTTKNNNLPDVLWKADSPNKLGSYITTTMSVAGAVKEKIWFIAVSCDILAQGISDGQNVWIDTRLFVTRCKGPIENLAVEKMLDEYMRDYTLLAKFRKLREKERKNSNRLMAIASGLTVWQIGQVKSVLGNLDKEGWSILKIYQEHTESTHTCSIISENEKKFVVIHRGGQPVNNTAVYDIIDPLNESIINHMVVTFDTSKNSIHAANAKNKKFHSPWLVPGIFEMLSKRSCFLKQLVNCFGP